MPITVPITTPIDYLIQRKYPSPVYLKYSGKSLKNLPYANVAEWEQIADAYRIKLEAQSPEEITNLYRAEKKKETEEAKMKAELEEKSRFYNQREADADFEFWGKAKHWTLDEAIALSLGKSPAIVNWKTIALWVNSSSLAAQYASIRDLALRAVAWKELFDPVLPGLYIAWAKRYDIPFSQKLEETVIKYGGHIGDWKTSYDALKEDYNVLKAHYDEYAATAISNLKEKNEQIAALTGERDALLARTSEAVPSSKFSKQESLNPKARESLLKLVIGMAVDAYGYAPKAPKSPIPKELVDNFAKHGLSIDEDTVRKWLREAAQLLPSETEMDE